MNETKAVFAERTIRSLKIILYRYKEDYGYKYMHKLPQFITTLNCKRNSSIDMRPNTVNNFDFMSFLYTKTSRENKKPIFKIWDRVQISKNELPFRKGYKPQFTREVFGIVAIATKCHQHTQSKMSKTRFFLANFIKKSWVKSFKNGFAYKRVGFERFWRIVLRQYTQFFYKLFTRASTPGMAMEGCNFR